MKKRILNFIHHILFRLRTIPFLMILPGILFIVLVGAISFTINRTQAVISKEIYATLATIKFIEDTPLGPQEINFTDKTLNIFGTSVERGEKVFVTTEELLKEIQIQDIVFPPLREERLKIVDNSNQGFVENYFKAVYNLMSELNTTEDLNQITMQAIDGKLDQITYARNQTKSVYRDMYGIEVPREAVDLHKNYLRIIQTQYNLFDNIANIKNDPARLRIDLILTQEILVRLQEVINQQLEHASQYYNVKIQKNSTSS
jgi:hypothetical protein